MNRNSRIALPGWLDARTIAMLSAFIALGAMTQTSMMALRDDMGAMEQRLRDDMGAMERRLRDDMGALEATLRREIGHVRTEGRDGRRALAEEIGRLDERLDRFDQRLGKLDERLGKLDERLRKVEVGVATIQAGMPGFDARLLAVEQQAHGHGRGDGAALP